MKYETTIIGQLKKVLRPKDEIFRNKLYVFLICLTISIFLWFLIALSGQSVSSLEYPIVYKNLPEDLLLVNHPDSILTFRVASGGFEMITIKYLTRRKPIEIDLSNLNLESRENHFVATYSTSRISQALLDRYMFSEELVSINPHSIYFKFEPLTGKKVPVIPELSLSFQGLYRLTDSITAAPDSVLITGTDNILDQIEFVKTVIKEVKNISGPVKLMAKIQMPGDDRKINVRPDEVELTINTEKYTEATIDLPVTTIQPDVKVKTFPEKVKVTYLVPLKDYSRIKPEMFNVVISITEKDTSSLVPVEVLSHPSFTEIIKVEPASVEYFVIGND